MSKDTRGVKAVWSKSKVLLCKTEPPCESQSFPLALAQIFEKVFTLYLVCERSQPTKTACRIFKKKLRYLLFWLGLAVYSGFGN